MIKRKEIIVTIIISALLILGGTIGFSICYELLFQPERIVESKSTMDEDWEAETQAYKRSVLYPFQEWKNEAVLIEKGSYESFTGFHHRDGERYRFLKELLKLFGVDMEDIYDCKTRLYAFDTASIEYKEYGLSYVFEIMMDENGKHLFLTGDKNDVIVSCQYYDALENSGEISQMSITREDVPTELLQVFQQLDYVYDGGRYEQLTVAMGESVEFPIGRGSLSVYAAYADWELYSDETMAAYVGIVGEYNFIFYYDKVKEQICGFHIGMNLEG